MGNNRELFESNTVYHVFNHGNAEDLIFREDTNYGFFLKRFQNYVPPIADTYAFCLMPNHFHVMVRVKNREELVEFYHKKNPQGLRNPIKHGFVDNITDWPYSSYHSIISSKSTNLKREEVFKWFGGRQNFI